MLGFGRIGLALVMRQDNTFANPVLWADLADPEVFRVKGVWASSLGYRQSNGIFYWYGCIQGEGKTHIFTASNPEGP